MAVLPERIELTLFIGLGDIPAFNPDIADDAAPASVMAFRSQVAAANGVLFSSPEYAHGVPGSLKNALDWLVGSGEFVDKPVALLSARRAAFAHASLTETLLVMSAKIVPDACLTLGLTSNRMDEHVILANPEFSAALRDAMQTFGQAIGLSS
jgi:NAD(P)H-dependent FMN reductase